MEGRLHVRNKQEADSSRSSHKMQEVAFRSTRNFLLNRLYIDENRYCRAFQEKILTLEGLIVPHQWKGLELLSHPDINKRHIAQLEMIIICPKNTLFIIPLNPPITLLTKSVILENRKEVSDQRFPVDKKGVPPSKILRKYVVLPPTYLPNKHIMNT